MNCIKLKKNFMPLFNGWGSTASRLEPLREGSLLFTTKIKMEMVQEQELQQKVKFYWVIT